MAQTYSIDLRKAALRHYVAAERLYDAEITAVAGYLFGLAAECALKELMRRSGMRELDPTQRAADPFYLHFEVLREQLRLSVQGHLTAQLRRFCEQPAFMQHWDIRMRYSHGGDVDRRWVERWRKDAKRVIETMQDN